MMKLSLALSIAVLIVGTRSASALSDFYRISGNSCVSITPGLIPTYDPEWGAKAPSTDMMDVACPIFLPLKNYTSLKMNVSGYNRQLGDPLNCTVNATDYLGGSWVSRNVSLYGNQAAGMFRSTTMPLNGGAGGVPNNFISVTCHLPRGENYLTGIEIIPSY